MKEKTLSKKQVKKTSKKNYHNKSFYFMGKIISSIESTGKLPYLDITKQSLNYYVSTLKKNLCIEKIGYGTWKLRKKPWESFLNRKVKKKEMSFKASPKPPNKIFTSSIRGHGLIARMQIPKIPRWDIRQDYLKNKQIPYTSIHKGSNQQIELNGFTIWLCKNTIVFYQKKDNSVFNTSAKEAYKEMIYKFKTTIKRLENLLGISFKINRKHKYTIERKHFGSINNDIALDAHKRQEKYIVKDDEGEWFRTDKSFLVEGETTHKHTSVRDMDRIITPFLNDLKYTYEETGELPKISDIIKILNIIATENKETAAGLNGIVKLMTMNIPKEDNLKETKIKDYFG